MARVLFVIAKKDFQDVEFADTKAVLESVGHDVVIASTEPGLCKGAFGAEAVASLTLNDAREDFDSFDAVVFIGGAGAHDLKDDKDALALAAGAANTGKVLAAICIAPTVLAAAGVVAGGLMFDVDMPMPVRTGMPLLVLAMAGVLAWGTESWCSRRELAPPGAVEHSPSE